MKYKNEQQQQHHPKEMKTKMMFFDVNKIANYYYICCERYRDASSSLKTLQKNTSNDGKLAKMEKKIKNKTNYVQKPLWSTQY